jgi:phenylpyruvate tautomerase PptA (4-oxalocrotonate tautomerase family)
MPLVQIDIDQSVPQEQVARISKAVNTAISSSLDGPVADRFQIVRRRAPGELVFDDTFLGVERRNVVFLQITMQQGKDPAVKARMLNTISDSLVEVGIRRDDVFITITENTGADWYAGKQKQALA